MKKKMLALVLALIMLLMCCGCERVPQTRDIELVIIGGIHANAVFPNVDTLVNDTHMGALVRNAVEYGKDQNGKPYGKANIHVILCDGNPEVLEQHQLRNEKGKEVPFLYKGGTFQNTQNFFANLTEDLAEALNNKDLIANDEGVDLIAAISKARDILNASDKKEKYIMILDTGIVTENYTKMQSDFDIQDYSVDQLISALPDDAFIDLDGIYVEFYGLGCVDGKDQKLTIESVKKKLVDFWNTYFEECGAVLTSPLTIITDTGGRVMRYIPDDPNGFPRVPVVSYKDEQTVLPKKDEAQMKDGEAYLEFQETTLQFEPGKSTFLDGDTKAAIDALMAKKSYFDQVLAADDKAIFYVVGSIAQAFPTSTKENGSISLERAYNVATLMIQHLGIPEENIMVIQGGLNELPWREGEEYDANGNPIKEVKQSHRVVAVLPSYFPANISLLKGEDPKYPADLLSIALTYAEAPNHFVKDT